MAEEKEEKQAATNGGKSVGDERYRYIGFDVFPKRVREFWRSDEERNSYLKRVHDTAGRFVPLSRANSFVATQALSGFERMILTLSSALMVVAPALPWFSFTRGEERFAYSGLAVAMNMGSVTSYLSMGAGRLSLLFFLLLGLMVVGVAFGVLSLALLYSGNPSGNEAYVSRLRRVLAWHYLPIAGWVAFFVISAVPTEIPFAGSLGLNQLESSLNIGSLAASSSFGFWLPFAAVWVNAIKSNDL